MSEYNFSYVYEHHTIREQKSCESFSDAVDHAAKQYNLLQEPGAIDPAAGQFIWVEIIHTNTNYLISTLTHGQLHCRKYSVTVGKGLLIFPAEKQFTRYAFTMILGAIDYQQQLAEVLACLSEIYLQEFNRKTDSYPLPVTYLNEPDGKRNLQYLAEFCRIAAFQLQGNEARTW